METKRGFGVWVGVAFIIILNWGSIGPKEVGEHEVLGHLNSGNPSSKNYHFSTQDKKAQKWVLIPYGKAP